LFLAGRRRGRFHAGRRLGRCSRFDARLLPIPVTQVGCLVGIHPIPAFVQPGRDRPGRPELCRAGDLRKGRGGQHELVVDDGVIDLGDVLQLDALPTQLQQRRDVIEA
jgi:hypothetical protein